MADEEHFSLCWNNFNSNLSTGFHESLCRGDLVDVTLVAEGQMVRAHRLVLSVCSPLFREMFAAMLPNQQAFVVLPNITHAALQDLITFIYCGEVNVKNEALSTFISTAESLQIKGLTDTDTVKTEVQDISTNVITVPTATLLAAPSAPVTRTVQKPVATARPAPKRVSRPAPVVESGESSAEEAAVRVAPTVVAHKRLSTVKAMTPVTKRMKTSTPNTTPAQTTSTRKQQPKAEPTDIEVELPLADVEPEEENEEPQDPIGDVDVYTDSKYDDTFYSENQTKTEAASYTLDTSTGEVTATEDQGPWVYLTNKRNNLKVYYGGNVYVPNEKDQVKNRRRNWKCSMYYRQKCRARVTTKDGKLSVPVSEHTHEPIGLPEGHSVIKTETSKNLS